MDQLALLILGFAWKAAVAMAVIVAAVRTARHAGPLLGSIVMTLPVSAGPGFLFLSLDEPAGYIAAGALYTLAGTAAVLAFVTAFAHAARRFGLAGSLAVGFAVWLVGALLLRELAMSLALAVALVAAAALAAQLLRRRLDLHARPASDRGGWPALLARAALGGLFIALVGSSGELLPAAVAGLLLAFPINYATNAVILTRQHGLEFAAATLSAGRIGMIGFWGFLLPLHLLAGPLPGPGAVGVALVCSFLTAAALAGAGLYWRRLLAARAGQ